MKHLHLAATVAQHAAGKIQFSGSETADIRIAGAVAIAGCLFGMYRTVTKPGRDARAEAAYHAAQTERAGRMGQEWLAANTTSEPAD